MNKVAKAILAGLLGIVALAAGGLLFLNIYIQSEATQHRIEHDLSKALRVPIRIQGTAFSPFGGLKLTGITVPDASRGGDSTFLESASVTAHLQIWPILARRFILDEIAVNDPHVVWERRDDGKWVLPSEPKRTPPPGKSAPESPSPEEPATATATPSPEESVAAATPIAASVPPTAHLHPLFTVEIQRFRVIRGSFDFLDKDAQPVASLAGIDIAGEIDGQSDVKGVATSRAVTLLDRFVLNDFRAPFNYAAETLAISNLTAEFAGGALRGDVELVPTESGTPFTAKLNFEDVDLGRLLTRAGVTGVKASGKIKGFVELGSEAGRRQGLDGRGAIVLRNGEMEQYGVLQELGRALQIDDLIHLKLSEAEARYTIKKGDVLLNRLVLRSQNLQIDATGKIRHDSKLDLNARLTLDRVPGFVEDSFTKSPDSDRRYIDFKINGTLDRPKTNLIELVLGRQLKQEMIDFMRMLKGQPASGGESK